MSAVQCVTQKTLCTNCGIPADSEYFDESGFADLPAPGNEVVLARFDLHHQYCGILECFSQFTDLFFGNAAEARTPGLEWLLLVNRRPLSPYVNLQAILNPWGFGSFCVRLRLPEAAQLEFVTRRRSDAPATAIRVVGGRITGRYWFNRD
jgi:hypothetical protein